MKTKGNDPSKGTSFWGMVFSIALHASVIVLILFWGFRGASEYSGSSGPIQVSLSSLDTGQGNNAPAKNTKPKKAEPTKAEKKAAPKKVESKEVKAPPEPPQKEEHTKEPEKEEIKKVEKKEEPKKETKKEEKPKEVVKKEPEKKEVIPLEPEKKEEKKKEEPKKEEKKAAEKPKPTEKPKPKKEEKKVAKKTRKKTLDKERSRVLKDIQRQKVLEQLGSGEEPEEPIGEEQRLAMADAEDAGLDTTTESRGPTGSSNGGSSVSPVIINLYSQQVHRKISRNWRIPPSLPTDGRLETDVLFKVGKDGKIYDVRVSDSSGNPVFDEYCVTAVYKSAPLPPPPSELQKEAKDKGVILTFRNEP